MEGGSTAVIDMTTLTDYLTLEKFGDVIESILPLIGVAVLVGFIFYAVRYGISLFRGV